ncbi:MAG TPA: serine hydrolase, partial [Planctomycetaceae bacterium]
MRRSLNRFAVPVAAGLAAVLLGTVSVGADEPRTRPVPAPKPSPRVERLAERIDRLVAGHEGDVAVAVVNLDTGESLFRRADEPMPTASLIKLAVLVEAYRQDRLGRVSLDETVTLREEDKVPGSGILTSHFSPGATLSLRDAARLMIAFSDNTATNLVLDRIGLESVNETTARLGCPDMWIHAKVFRGDASIAPDRSRRFGLGSTTARQTVSLLARLHRKEIIDETACDEMLAHLAACDDTLKVRRGLPPGAKWAHKTGSVNAVRTDAGLLETPSGTVALCVLTANNKDTSWGDENAGDVLCGAVGRAVYEAFSRRADGTLLAEETGPAGPLSLGANGDLVADLQRTLNAVLDPPAGLSVDGDFGPVTKA